MSPLPLLSVVCPGSEGPSGPSGPSSTSVPVSRCRRLELWRFWLESCAIIPSLVCSFLLWTDLKAHRHGPDRVSAWSFIRITNSTPSGSNIGLQGYYLKATLIQIIRDQYCKNFQSIIFSIREFGVWIESDFSPNGWSGWGPWGRAWRTVKTHQRQRRWRRCRLPTTKSSSSTISYETAKSLHQFC